MADSRTILDAEQSQIRDTILSALRSGSEKQYFLVAGLAGTGKTYLVKEILVELNTNRLVLGWGRRKASGSGCTRPVLTERMVQGLRLRRLQEVLSDRAVLILDELQAIQGSAFEALSDAFKTLRREKTGCNLPFGGVPVILTGDPCQLGRVPFHESEQYTETSFPTTPCWLTDTYKLMDPVTFYMELIHRGQDTGYLQMLAEIRNSSEGDRGVPRFSPAAMAVLENIRDRDGGNKAPR
ncbi:hypothetical protein FOZ60_016362 [Perkinsus olseni]|uniref:ATP-dependent DNA helicase n=1 Tax=Perkinsus olseni TaxID=32597 RepID=A0A7J6N3U4_PEROL|nr:hypothetical protein FOZ60_016362 [Perkinsus olseni]